jgi:alpha-beta hydrolase superfamily lysophospholipase
LMSYNNTYTWDKPLNYFFQDKYAQALTTYMSGDYDGWQINSKLTTSISELLNPDFLNGLKTEGQETEFKEALLNNSVSGWKTNIPIRLYHGTEDEIIPYQNSELTLEHFENAGSADVTLTLIEGGTHGSSFMPMLKDFIPWFESLRN